MRRLLFVLIVAGLGALLPAFAAGAGPSAPPTTMQKTAVNVAHAGDESAAPSVPTDTNIVGVQWSGDASAKFQVEARVKDGKWYPQGSVTAPDGGADPGSAEARNAARRIGAGYSSEPVQVTDNAAQVRLKVTHGNVHDVHIVAVGSPPGFAHPDSGSPLKDVNPLAAGGMAFAAAGAVSTKRGRRGSLLMVLIVGMVASAALIGVPSAHAAAPGDVPFPPNPGYVSRAQWGADESLRQAACPEGPQYATPKLIVVHHTDTSNSYSPAQTASIVRGIYVYYIQGRGYCDIGYNFLVDRYGIIYEGRYGGADKGVIGAHATNFNTGTVGIAMIGTHSTVPPTAATFNSLANLIAWKMSIHQINPFYPVAFRGAILNPIIGHRDAGAVSGDGTACPGNAGEAIIPQLIVNVRPRVAFGYPVGNLEVARRQPNAIQVSGWTADPDTTAPIRVDFYVDNAGAATTTANLSRPDVARTYPNFGSQHGFNVTIPVSQAPHLVCAYGISVGNGGNHLIGCALLPGNTVGALDTSTRGPGVVLLHGWAIDPDTVNPTPIHVYVDGVGTAIGSANQNRPDVGNANPGYGNAHGFDIGVPVTGDHTVCAYAISTRGKPNITLGCTRTSGVPRGALDTVTKPSAGAVRMQGWALDPDTAGAITVPVYIDGVYHGFGTANTSRPDVGHIFNGWGDNHGYDFTVGGLAPGAHQVCTYAVSVLGGGNATLGCKTILL
jgi:hypothetical protein